MGDEWLISGAPVYTADAPRRRTHAVLVRDGVIAAVGETDEVRAAAGPGARRIELDGGMVVPGFQDAHIHALHGGLAKLQCDLHDLPGREQVLEKIRSYVAGNPGDSWILGSGWTLDAFVRTGPTAAELDAIVGDRPALLMDTNFHSAWSSSAALRLSGIGRSTPDPPDGRFERASDGSPSGTLHEGAIDLVQEHAPKPSPDQLRRGLLLAQEHLHSLGITAWQDAWLDSELAEIHRAAALAGELSARVVGSLVWDAHRDADQIDELAALAEHATVPGFEARTIKIFLDGVVENGTGSMLEPYLDEQGGVTDNRGIDMVDPVAVLDYVTEFDRRGLQVHFHAIGDRAVRTGLDACEAALTANGPRDSRHHIAHIQVVHPDDRARFRRLGVVANAQPLWACNEPTMTDLTVPFLGPERSAWQYPFGSLRRAGAPLAFGSDWPVSSPDPLLEMEVAVRRVDPADPDGEPFYPDERLDIAAALDAFTIGAAFVNRMDDRTGSLEVGKAADLAVLEHDLFELDGRLSQTRVVLTMVGGRVVHDRGLT
ncbi:MAG: amidohydrolase [Actinomycetota bacterium]